MFLYGECTRMRCNILLVKIDTRKSSSMAPLVLYVF